MADEQSSSEPVVRHAPDQHRYEIWLDTSRAGFAEYIESSGQRIFHHTEIGEEFGGRGLAGTLVRSALESTRADGKRIVPVCPFVDSYIKKHNDFGDLVDPVTPQALDTVRETQG